MMETGNPLRRGGTEHREAGAKNIGFLFHLDEKYYDP